MHPVARHDEVVALKFVAPLGVLDSNFAHESTFERGIAYGLLPFAQRFRPRRIERLLDVGKVTAAFDLLGEFAISGVMERETQNGISGFHVEKMVGVYHLAGTMPLPSTSAIYFTRVGSLFCRQLRD